MGDKKIYYGKTFECPLITENIEESAKAIEKCFADALASQLELEKRCQEKGPQFYSEPTHKKNPA